MRSEGFAVGDSAGRLNSMLCLLLEMLCGHDVPAVVRIRDDGKGPVISESLQFIVEVG